MNQRTFALQRCSVGSWAGGPEDEGSWVGARGRGKLGGGPGIREAGLGTRGSGKPGWGPKDQGSWAGGPGMFDKLFEEKLSAVHMDIAQKRRKFRRQTFCGFGNT